MFAKNTGKTDAEEVSLKGLNKNGRHCKKFCFKAKPELQKNKIMLPEQSDNRLEANGHSE